MVLPETDRNQVYTCQTAGLDIFSKGSLSECEGYVRGVQRKLDRAVANDDKSRIRGYVRCLNKSKAVKILAIHRVCEVNSGRHTAGIDGMAMPKDKKERRRLMISLISEINIKQKPSPIRRVYIPKPNGDVRPLGIPTIMDRIIQEIIRVSIEPICEYHFLPCSYGFHPKRSCQDAVMDLFTKLSQKNSRRWIVEGDIKGCFDHIKHTHIISTLWEWDIPNNVITIIENMLKAGVMKELTFSPSDEGTPQGGIISPILSNVALTYLDETIRDRYTFGQKRTNPLVRYADDFVIIAKNEEQAQEIKSYIGLELKNRIGVELSDDKTHITEISDGFDFLGFNIRKYKNRDIEKLLIMPSKKNVKEVIQKLREIFDFALENGSSIDTLIRLLNPIIRGWANYYRHFVSKRAFYLINNRIWSMTSRFLTKKYPNQLKSRWSKLFFKMVEKDRWHLHDRDTGATITKMSRIPIVRYVKVKKDVRVYDGEAIEYWEKREVSKTKDSIYGSVALERLFKRQKGRCVYCRKPFYQEDIQESATHKHHLKPRSEGGNWKLSNLRLLHSECHTSLHSLFSRKEMADLADKKIDYVRLMKPSS